MLFYADVNVAFQQSAHNVLLDDDKLLQKLRFNIPYKSVDKKDENKSRKPVGKHSKFLLLRAWFLSLKLSSRLS